MFKETRCSDAGGITRAQTLARAYFAQHPQFKEDYKTFSKAGTDAVDPFSNPAFLEKCFEHAMTGVGPVEDGDKTPLREWVYGAVSFIRRSLGDHLLEQTAGVRSGDFVALVESVNLAVLMFETQTPALMQVDYYKSTMAGVGGNDLLVFMASLTRSRAKLKGIGVIIPDNMAQQVLLGGLDQEIFAGLIDAAGRTPYSSCGELERAIVKEATKPTVSDKLRALRPGRPQMAMVIDTADIAHGQRIDRLEMLMTTMATGASAKYNAGGHAGGRVSSKEPCFDFFRGRCSRPDCRFQHVQGGQAHGAVADRARGQGHGQPAKYCALHLNEVGHTTEECTTLKQNPVLRAQLLMAGEPPGAAANGGKERVAVVHEFAFVTREVSPSAREVVSRKKVGRFVLDSGSTTHATYDEGRCFDVEECHVVVEGSNSDAAFVCVKKGKLYVNASNTRTGGINRLLLTDVLINPIFPFHIFSEVRALEAGCIVGKVQGMSTITTVEGAHVLDASQQLLPSGVKLYFIDEAPVSYGEPVACAEEGPLLLADDQERPVELRRDSGVPVIFQTEEEPAIEGAPMGPVEILGDEHIINVLYAAGRVAELVVEDRSVMIDGEAGEPGVITGPKAGEGGAALCLPLFDD
jgi:hypothetical protein